MAKITICSVFHSEESKKLLELNFDLVNKLNSDADFEWVIADNLSSESLVFSKSFHSPEKLGSRQWRDFQGENADNRPPQERTNYRFEKIQGIREIKIIRGIPKAPDNIPDWIKPSFHHNTAMNMSIPHIKTRFALFLDSDFYILPKDWIKKATDHMQKNNLTFLGTPWHPKTYRVFRYFPCHQCLFVDFEKLKEAGYNPEDLDFNPTRYDEKISKPPKKKFGKLSRILNIFDFSERKKIGNEWHTAHRLFEVFYNNPKIKFEVISAVFKPGRESYPALNLIYGFNRLVEFFLPDRLCYIPKDRRYYSTRRFKKMGYYDAWGKEWEEYIWNGEPFGIHVRPIKQIKKGQNIEEIIATLKECFSSFNIYEK